MAKEAEPAGAEEDSAEVAEDEAVAEVVDLQLGLHHKTRRARSAAKLMQETRQSRSASSATLLLRGKSLMSLRSTRLR
eukprot:977292-Rhodomonas_salina.1